MQVSETLTTTVSTKGQVILPKAIRQALRWEAGMRLTVESTPDGVSWRPGEEPMPELSEAETRSEDVYGKPRGQARRRAEVPGRRSRSGRAGRIGSSPPSSGDMRAPVRYQGRCRRPMWAEPRVTIRYRRGKARRSRSRRRRPCRTRHVNRFSQARRSCSVSRWRAHGCFVTRTCVYARFANCRNGGRHYTQPGSLRKVASIRGIAGGVSVENPVLLAEALLRVG